MKSLWILPHLYFNLLPWKFAIILCEGWRVAMWGWGGGSL